MVIAMVEHAEANDDSRVEWFNNRYFIEIDSDKYITGMFVAVCQKENIDYTSKNLIEISEEDYQLIGPNSLFLDGVIVQGNPRPAVIDTDTKRAILAAKNRKATEVIQTLQDAVDLKMATEGESEALREWKKYRVLLGRVDPENWPDTENPGEPDYVA